MAIKDVLLSDEMPETNVYLHEGYCTFHSDIADDRAEDKFAICTVKPILVQVTMRIIKGSVALNTDSFVYNIETCEV
jgi:hypothetical protein